MEYTNDVVFNIRYKKDEIDSVTYGKCKMLKKIVKWIENDVYFTVVICVSIIALFIDFLLVKQFIDIVNLL